MCSSGDQWSCMEPKALHFPKKQTENKIKKKKKKIKGN
jgi:hypothetical protein